MKCTICTVSHYDTTAEMLWDHVMDFAALADINGPMVRMRGLDGPPFARGETRQIQLSLHGIFPWRDYEITVVSLDPSSKRAVTLEQGAGVRAWRHEIAVDATQTGARLTDRVSIEAGPFTPVFALWAKVMYLQRIPRRRRILAGFKPVTEVGS